MRIETSILFIYLEIDVYDTHDNYVGHLTHSEHTKLPARKGYPISMKTTIKPTLGAIMTVSKDCLSAHESTVMRTNGTLDGSFLRMNVPVSFGPDDNVVDCVPNGKH